MPLFKNINMKKIILVLVFGFFVFAGKSQLTDAQLITQADSIKNATIAGFNTANRVGRMFENIIYNKINNVNTTIPYLAGNNNFTGSVDSFQTIVISGTAKIGGSLTVDNTTIPYFTGDTTLNAAGGGAVPTGGAIQAYVANHIPNTSSFQTITNLSNNVTTDSASTTKYPSVNAVKTYVDAHSGSSYNKHYYDYRVRLYQSGTTAPSVQAEFVDEIDSADEYNGGTRTEFEYIGVGQYSFTIFSVQNKFNNIAYNTDISFSDNKITNGGYSMGSSGGIYNNVFYFNTYNSSHTLTDGLITFTNLYIRVYY